MNKTAHQRFLYELRRQLSPDPDPPSGYTSGYVKKRRSRDESASSASKEDILWDIRRQFEELFDNPEDDSGEDDDGEDDDWDG